MNSEKLKDACMKALDDGAEYVLSYVEGYDGSHPQAARITKQNIDSVIFDEYCGFSLPALLKNADKSKKTGIVVKPCDSRALVVLLQENQIKRENIKIIGVECKGVKDRKGKDDSNCKGCVTHKPVIYDYYAEEEGELSTDRGDFEDVAEFEEKDYEERYGFWEEYMDDCIRCYACREACPLCYCDECIVEKTMPQWVDFSVKPSSNWMYHLIRAFHEAGRCVNCGSCSRACPKDIPLMLINRKMASAVEDMFGFVSGMDIQKMPPVITLAKDDPDDILKGGMGHGVQDRELEATS